MTRIVLAVLLAFCLAGFGCKGDGSKDAEKGKKEGASKVDLCKKAQKNMRAATEEMLKDMPAEMKDKAMKDLDEEFGDKFLEECQKQDEAEIKCAAEAKDMKAMEECVRKSGKKAGKEDEGEGEE